MCSRRYPDVMLCGSMNLPPLLLYPEWLLWRFTKRTSIDHAESKTAQMVRLHSKTPGSLNAVGRIQDTRTFVMIYIYGICFHLPSRDSKWLSTTCYHNHYHEVQKQTVSFWQNWLAPIPIWLNSVVLMQQIEVHKEGLLRDTEFDCSAL